MTTLIDVLWRRFVVIGLLVLSTGCATTKVSLLPHEPESRWVLATLPKAQAPLERPARSCFPKEISVFAKPTSIEICSWNIDRGRWRENHVLNERVRRSAEDFYSAPELIIASAKPLPELPGSPVSVPQQAESKSQSIPSPLPVDSPTAEPASELPKKPVAINLLPNDALSALKISLNARR